MKINSKSFRVAEGDEVNLRKWPTTVEPVYKSKEHYQKLLGEHVAQLSSLQQLLYASNRYAVLLIFQAMDAAGKDGAIKHVMSGVNPQGCQVFSFKHPSPAELQHDFLWRTTRELPERGRIGIFNRSYYEEVLIVRVHPEILRGEGLPDASARREDGLAPTGIVRSWIWRDTSTATEPVSSSSTSISRRRSSESASFNASMSRKRTGNSASRTSRSGSSGSEYMTAYEECLSATSTREAPWYVVPADDKENARLIVSQIILDTLEGLEMTYSRTERRAPAGIAVDPQETRPERGLSAARAPAKMSRLVSRLRRGCRECRRAP